MKKLPAFLIIAMLTLLNIAWAGFSVAMAELGPEKLALHIEPIKMPLPEYNVGMMRAGLESDEKVRFTVEPDGSVSRVELESANQREFDEAVIAAIKTWRFSSVWDLKNRAPASIELRCIIKFCLQPEGFLK